MLANPWLVESEANAPPPAAIKRHYRQRLLSLEGWKRILTGAVSYKKLLKGLSKMAAAAPATLAVEVAASFEANRLPLSLILATGDATAVAAEAEWNSARYAKIRAANPALLRIESDSHTFARPGDMDALTTACVEALSRLSGGR